MNDIRRVEPVILEGRKVRLEPLALEHVPLLAAVALDPDLWQWTLARRHHLPRLRRQRRAHGQTFDSQLLASF